MRSVHFLDIIWVCCAGDVAVDVRPSKKTSSNLWQSLIGGYKKCKSRFRERKRNHFGFIMGFFYFTHLYLLPALKKSSRNKFLFHTNNISVKIFFILLKENGIGFKSDYKFVARLVSPFYQANYFWVNKLLSIWNMCNIFYTNLLEEQSLNFATYFVCQIWFSLLDSWWTFHRWTPGLQYDPLVKKTYLNYLSDISCFSYLKFTSSFRYIINVAIYTSDISIMWQFILQISH